MFEFLPLTNLPLLFFPMIPEQCISDHTSYRHLHFLVVSHVVEGEEALSLHNPPVRTYSSKHRYVNSFQPPTNLLIPASIFFPPPFEHIRGFVVNITFPIKRFIHHGTSSHPWVNG